MSIKSNQRLVIKVGSALIAPENNGCSSHHLLSIAQFILRCRKQGKQVILVSSGSVAAGRQWIDIKSPSIALKKAMAAAGQTNMMAVWDKLFDFPTAQILLTHADLCNKERYASIKETIESLLGHGVLPIVNENDTVTSEELKVGDNDNLAAMVAASTGADGLILCTDVDGLFDKNPQQHADAKLIKTIDVIDESIYQMAGGATSSMGTGGMQTKIEAAEKAVAHGIDTYVVNGFNHQTFSALLQDENPGSHFVSCKTPMSPEQHWMTHTVRERGEVVIEDQHAAISQHDDVITSASILSVKGEFAVGDTILIRTDDGSQVAKATSNYSSCLLNYLTQQANTSENVASQPQNNSIISPINLAVLQRT
ncbi:glutamate 5-kinase [Shewanella sp. 10N.286.52.B9]|uniref:glutamate 5-kinase n=1 Tax=Shewanella sp. 10N.286.52.B9 TaxID=1880837 RepID=UPI000C831561|nr:glutamate 5-kinase [Shewanella sp. 10N.286.52.B9]PMG42270.1 glutamate 5-kinase [Shewanella sp. 10N.286.52.B9]